MHLLLCKTTWSFILWILPWFIIIRNVGIFGDQYLAPFSLLPEFQSRIERENKSQTDEDQSITFVTDKLDNVAFDLQPRWLMILYFSLKQTPPKVSDRAGDWICRSPEKWRLQRAQRNTEQVVWWASPEALSPCAQPFLFPWAGVRKGQTEASGVNPKFLPMELWWCLGEKEIPQ